MIDKEKIREIIQKDNQSFLSADKYKLVFDKAIIPLDHLIDYVISHKGENDEYLHTAIGEGIEYFSS